MYAIYKIASVLKPDKFYIGATVRYERNRSLL